MWLRKITAAGNIRSQNEETDISRERNLVVGLRSSGPLPKARRIKEIRLCSIGLRYQRAYVCNGEREREREEGREGEDVFNGIFKNEHTHISDQRDA